MTNRTYDKKNLNDYDAITSSLHNALVKIEKDTRLPATQAQIVRMTGIHRNTLRNRESPLIKLQEIKKNRKLTQNLIKAEKLDSIKVLEEKLLKMSKELAYWYESNRT